MTLRIVLSLGPAPKGHPSALYSRKTEEYLVCMSSLSEQSGESHTLLEVMGKGNSWCTCAPKIYESNNGPSKRGMQRDLGEWGSCWCYTEFCPLLYLPSEVCYASSSSGNCGLPLVIVCVTDAGSLWGLCKCVGFTQSGWLATYASWGNAIGRGWATRPGCVNLIVIIGELIPAACALGLWCMIYQGR